MKSATKKSLTLKQSLTRFLCYLALISGGWFKLLPAIAASPSPGTIIENQATGSFIDSEDTTNTVQPVESNIVQVTVAEVAAIFMNVANVSDAPSGVTNAGTFQTIAGIHNGDIVYFDFDITNKGNDPTQFFIPSSATITGGTLDTTGIRIIAYSDGTTTTNFDGQSGRPNEVVVPSGGKSTGGTGGLLTSLAVANNGSILPNGSIRVRVPVKVTATSGNTMTVLLGNTPEDSTSTATPKTRLQNQSVTTPTNAEVYTVDNSDPAANASPPDSTKETIGTPVNGIVEASAIASATVLVDPGFDVSGTIFEDINYGGGSGRINNNNPDTPEIAGVLVELYDSNGNFLNRTATTDGTGKYTFNTVIPGTYYVRVVTNTIQSQRTGGSSCGPTSSVIDKCIPVQTYRTDASDDTQPPIAVTNKVGGEVPSGVDQGAVSAGAKFDTTNFTFTSGGTNRAQSVTRFKVGTAPVTGLDFGFNFDTIVNTNNSGQGSLRQFIINSNALGGEASLVQVGQPNNYETSIFMIPNGVANLGQNVNYSNQLTNGIAVINLTQALPTISDTRTRLDGSTQTTNVRATVGGAETNPNQVGTGGNVGVDQIAIARFNRPEVEIKGSFTLTSTGTFNEVKNIAFNQHRILVSGNNSLIQDNLVGMSADGTSTTTSSTMTGYGIEIASNSSNITIRHNYLRVDQSGIRRDGNGSNLLIESNETDVPTNGQTNTYEGILIIGSGSNDIVRSNLVKNMRGSGTELGFNNGSLTNTLLENNTYLNNGFHQGSPSTETLGIVAYQAPNSTITIRKNIITGNSGPGIAVMSSTGVKITQNSIFNNGGLAIDLDPNTRDPNNYGTPNGVTLNDLNDADTGPNNLLNFPVFTSALLDGNNLIISGYARPTNIIELFIPDPDPTSFGEGKTYLTTITEGTNDRDSRTGSYNGSVATINGVNPGQDTTNQFRFIIPLTAGKLNNQTIAPGLQLTATATDSSNNTSEFSGLVTVANKNRDLDLVKRITKINDSTSNNTRTSAPVNLDVYDDGTGTEDDVTNWTMAGGSNYLKGKINGGEVLKDNTIEYTIYFRNSGNTPISNVRICDLIPANTTYINNSIKFKFGSNSEVAIGDPDNDNDQGEFLAANQSLNGLCRPDRDINQTVSAANNKHGAVWLQVDRNSNPLEPNQYGYLKFKVKVNQTPD